MRPGAGGELAGNSEARMASETHQVEPGSAKGRSQSLPGEIPVVRATGGLCDTVRDFDPDSREGTGFVFVPYEAGAMVGAACGSDDAGPTTVQSSTASSVGASGDEQRFPDVVDVAVSADGDLAGADQAVVNRGLDRLLHLELRLLFERMASF